MDISTEVSELEKTRKHVVRGSIDFDELVSFLRDVYSSKDQQKMHSLWDLRDADFTSVSEEGIRTLMEFVSTRWGTDGRERAAVVVSQDLGYEQSRLYQLMMDGATSSAVEVFRNINAAESWIAAAT
jgi:hypothetical protein